MMMNPTRVIITMTSHSDDTKRLEFLANSLNEAIVHLAIRDEKQIVQLYTRKSGWVDTTMGEKFVLDDLRMLIDEAINKAE